MISSALPIRLKHAHRQYHRVHASELEAALQAVGGLVVENAVKPSFVLKNEVAEEENGIWKLAQIIRR